MGSNRHTQITGNEMSNELDKSKLKLLMQPFPESEISWLPKPNKAQTDSVHKDFKSGIRCQVCGAWHHPQVAHLAYVGHAAVTKRILDVDPLWNWDFLQKDETGGPIFDNDGGMWITLTILGTTRKGYGSADGKKGPNATKEIIGDAIRNAGMRFGIALELWHKGEFEKHQEVQAEEKHIVEVEKQPIPDDRLNTAIDKIKSGEYTVDRLNKTFALTDEQQDKLADSGVLS